MLVKKLFELEKIERIKTNSKIPRIDLSGATEPLRN